MPQCTYTQHNNRKKYCKKDKKWEEGQGRIRKHKRGNEYNRGILYACMEISQ
jgi:hypothetical protein